MTEEERLRKNEENKIWRKNNKEYIKGYNKKYIQEHREQVIQQINNWGKNNPNKLKLIRTKAMKKQGVMYPNRMKARREAKYYIKIPENQLCQDCNKELATERHHKDYSKPLEVEFLCKKCHTKRG